VSFNCGCLAGSFKFSSSILEPDLHNFVSFSKTHALQPCSTSSSAPASGSSGHVGRRCPARGLHAPESLLLFGACDSHAPPSLAMHDVVWGLRWSIYGWVVPVTASVLHAPPSPTESAAVSTASSLFFEFFFFFFFFFFFSFALCCVFVFFPLVKSICVLLKFY